MKQFIYLASLCFLAACSKTDTADQPAQLTSQNKPETCEFGKTNFNLTKRAALNEEAAYVSKGPRNGGGGGNPPPPPPPPPPGTNAGVILLDFNGQTVSGTAWNTNSNIVCSPANLSAAAMNTIVDRVENDFAPFYITVTTDEAVYNAANPARRTRVILTETWEWFGQAGGTSFLNSFTWGNNTPCFVFSSLLGYNEKQIAEASSHESGHTLGLRHQATYNGTALLNEYNYGHGTGEIGWAPIMGCAYYNNMSTWFNGPNNLGYNSYQDDVAIIAGLVGLRTDDYSNTTSGAASLTSSLTGTINSSSDVDFFAINLSNASTLTATPFNVGVNNAGANLDMVVRIYNGAGQLINTINDPLLLNAGLGLNAGQYFISVSVAANPYASTYGQLSQYSIQLN
ncbi:MAG TPA: hypothetical protein VMZ03_00105 [Chitinophagaceae bacterium]|nr:hypothetical protein [Chitinophagaceae bacterium]